MAEPPERPGPDLRPWDQALAQRVQPVLSALFHDMMSPLTLLKNRLYLAQRRLREISRDPELPPRLRERLHGLDELLEGIEEAANRVHRGMTIPRDAIWATILEGAPFEPTEIVEQIAQAMRSPPADSPTIGAPKNRAGVHGAA